VTGLVILLGFAAADLPVPDAALIEAAADSLYAIGEFDAAALEYKRLLYFASRSGGKADSAEEVRSEVKLALALYRNGEKAEADSILYALDGALVHMVRAVLLVEEGDPFLAAHAVNEETQEALGAPAHRLRGWAYLEAGDYAQAAEEFRRAGEDSLAAAVAVLTKRRRPLRLKNPRTARFLSLLPGLGEAYAGRPLFGLWAFAVNAGDTYLVVNAVLRGHYVDAFLVYTFLWQRFYSGSMANASRFAREYNERRTAAVLDPIRERFKESDALRLDLDALNELYRLASDARAPETAAEH